MLVKRLAVRKVRSRSRHYVHPKYDQKGGAQAWYHIYGRVEHVIDIVAYSKQK